MANELTNEPRNPRSFNELSPQQQKEHRARVGVRAQSILSQFWQSDEPAAVRAVTLEGWMDVLESASEGEIREAWADYQRNGPRSASGRLLRPDPGALWKRIRERRPKPRLVKLDEPPRVVIYEETRKRRAAVLSDLVRELGAKAAAAGMGGRKAE